MTLYCIKGTNKVLELTHEFDVQGVAQAYDPETNHVFLVHKSDVEEIDQVIDEHAARIERKIADLYEMNRELKAAYAEGLGLKIS